MSCFAGIIRHGERLIPEGWVSALEGAIHAAGTVRRDRWDCVGALQAVFFGSAANVDEGPDDSLLLFDAFVYGETDTQAALANSHAMALGCFPRSYRRWGDEWLERVVADYALAFWDPDDGTLALSRSPLGSRPLFYLEHDGLFVFATSLPFLLALPATPRRLDDGYLSRLLCFDGTSLAASTAYASIKRLPAAHRLTVERGRIHLVAMSEPWATGSERGISVGQNPAETARRLLTEAVECRLQGGKNIAVHLSGGLDSSAIACIAARRLKQEGRRLIALCSVLPKGHQGPEADERPFINAVLAQEDNIDPVWVELPVDDDPFAALPRWFDRIGEPPYSNVTHVEERLAETARAHGVDVSLSGFGGDFFLSAAGTPEPAFYLSRGQMVAAMRAIWRLRVVGRMPWWRVIGDQLLRPLLRPYRLRWTMIDAGSSSPGLLDRVERDEGYRPACTIGRWAGASPHETMRYMLAPGRLERVIPMMRQVIAEDFAHDLRFPLLDSRLIAFVLAQPEQLLHCDGQPRSLMRLATRGILPEAVRLRTSKGAAFDPAIARRCALARRALREWVASAAPDCWDYVDRSRFVSALEAVEPAGRDGWRQDMFSVLLNGGRIAKFIDWHTSEVKRTCV